MSAISKPNIYTKTIDTAFDTVSGCVSQVRGFYERGENRLIKMLDTIVPESMRYIVDKIARTVPETIVSATLISGATRTAATIYGAVSLSWATSPMVRQALKGNFTNEAMQQAAKETIERLKVINDRFRPAIFIAFACASVACTVLGMASFNPGLVITGSFFGIISYIALESIEAPAPQREPEAPPKEPEAPPKEVPQEPSKEPTVDQTSKTADGQTAPTDSTPT